MPFDPAVPAPHADLASQMFRDQFTGLKDLIDTQAAIITGQAALIADLQTRVTALEPPVLTATGFGAPEANSPLTQIGDYDGHPLYQTAGGWNVFWAGDYPAYFITDLAPQFSPAVGYVNTSSQQDVQGQYASNGKPLPAGTVA